LNRFFQVFDETRRLLSAFPNAGRRRDELRAGLRSYLVHPFIVFYTSDARKRAIFIERVLHGHLDIDETHFDRG
jgi:plasmid stabilization system protein ParE